MNEDVNHVIYWRCVSVAMVIRWLYYIDAVMITRWNQCGNGQWMVHMCLTAKNFGSRTFEQAKCVCYGMECRKHSIKHKVDVHDRCFILWPLPGGGGGGEGNLY